MRAAHGPVVFEEMIDGLVCGGAAACAPLMGAPQRS